MNLYRETPNYSTTQVSSETVKQRLNAPSKNSTKQFAVI